MEEDVHECDGSEDDSNHGNHDIDSNSLEIFLLIKFTAKLTQD